MKPIAFALVLIAAATAGAAGAGTVLVLQPKSPEAAGAQPAAPKAEGSVAGSSTEVVERLEAEVRMLGNRMAELSRELQQVRTSAERTPVLEVAAAGEPPAAQVPVVVPKEQVATILSQLREEEERQRELERQERERRQVEARAGRIARELGMGPGDEARLADFMQQAGQKRDEVMAQAREGGFDRDTMRATFEGIRTWSSAELTKSFGPQLAEQIMQQGELGFGGPGGNFGGMQQQGARRRGGQAGGGGNQGGF